MIHLTQAVAGGFATGDATLWLFGDGKWVFGGHIYKQGRMVKSYLATGSAIFWQNPRFLGLKPPAPITR